MWLSIVRHAQHTNSHQRAVRWDKLDLVVTINADERAERKNLWTGITTVKWRLDEDEDKEEADDE